MAVYPPKYLLLFAFTVLSFQLMAQENCANGVDDDADGLVDLNDPDCTCYDLSDNTIASDFEDYTCCPTGFTGGGQGIECLDDGWGQASVASTDYVNTCGFMGGSGIPLAPTPLPSGGVAVCFITQTGWNEQVGTCMPVSMVPGETYTIEMYIGFNGAPPWESTSPFTMGIYGTTDCDNFPSTISGCLSDQAEWYELATYVVSGNQGEWVFVTFEFQVSEEIEAISIGGACSEMTIPGKYHWIDDVVITGNFGGEALDVDDIVETGDCISGVELSVGDLPGATYQWYLDGVAIPGATSNPYQVPGDQPGMYTVVVTNSSGCGSSGPYEVVIDNEVLEVEGSDTDVACFGDDDGFIDIELPDENPPFIIEWSNGDMTEDLADLPPGTYTVTITDANGCFGTETYIITEPDEALDASIVSIEQPVGGDQDGTVEIEVSGGTPDYSYLWDNGETTATATMLEPGNHFVTITDANGCEEVLEVVIYEPLTIEAEVLGGPCFGSCSGSIELEVTGGLQEYTYAWDNGGTAPVNMSLCEGIYIVTVTDAFGTQTILNYEIETPDELVLIGETPDPLCSDQLGFVELEVIGGTPGYQYIWSNNQTTQSVFDLAEGNYIVTVTDDVGCTAVESFTIEIYDPIVITADITQESCDGGGNGIIYISMTNGFGPFEYSWSTGYVGEDPDGLVSGTYIVTVTDVFGCTGTESFIVSQGGDIEVAITTQDVSCGGAADGSIDLEVQGGVPPYSYMWDNGETTQDLTGIAAGDYEVTIEDNGGCTYINVITIEANPGVEYSVQVFDSECSDSDNGHIHFTISTGTPPYTYTWSNNGTGPDQTDLAPGTYSVTITDANGCAVDTSLIVEAPGAIAITGTPSSASCPGMNDGSLEAEASGGTGPYSYLWSTGTTSSKLDSVVAGDYIVTVTDANGCTLDSVFSIESLDAIEVSGAVVNASCDGSSDGSIDVTVSGGTAPYSYSWSSGESTEDISGLAEGTYELTVTDVNGCIQIIEFAISGAGSIVVSDNITGILCNGDTNGSIDISTNGGTAPYSFSWSTGASTEDLTGIGAGDYVLTVTDAQGCELELEYTVDDVAPLDEITVVTDVDCYGLSTGSIEVSVQGGTGPYSFKWDTGSDAANLPGIEAGSYSLTITDANGCTLTGTYDVQQPDELVAFITNVTNPSMAGEKGSAEVVVSGGSEPYDIRWENGETGATATDLPVGFTTLSITDANGCKLQLEVEITVQALFVNYDITDNPCFGDCAGTVAVSVTGGLPPYSYQWSDGQDSDTAVDLCEGTYALTVTDGQGNGVTINNILVTTPPELVVSGISTDVSCVDSNDGIIELGVSGGTGPYTYSWTNGSVQAALNNLEPGPYAVTVTDNMGCSKTADFTIEDVKTLDLSLSAQDIDCDNPSGKIVISGDNSPGYGYLLNGQPVNTGQNSEITGLQPGDYLLEYVINSGCIIEVGQVEITERSNFTISIDPASVTTNVGEQVNFIVQINGIIQNHFVEWNTDDPHTCEIEDNDGNCIEISLSAQGDQTVVVTVTDEFGCTEEAVATLNARSLRNVFVPNVFSPNGDAVNDIFKPTSQDPGVSLNSFTIYNRWGEVMYNEKGSTLNTMTGWDGEYGGVLTPPGVYVYTLDLEHPDGLQEVLIGDVTVVR